MASLSDLNKKEREIRGEITQLRNKLRSNDITKDAFDKTFDKHSKNLEKIAEEKSKLIGLPPLPPPPMHGDSDTSDKPPAPAKMPAPPAPAKMPSPPKLNDPPAPPESTNGKAGLDAIKASILGKAPAPKPPGPELTPKSTSEKEPPSPPKPDKTKAKLSFSIPKIPKKAKMPKKAELPPPPKAMPDVIEKTTIKETIREVPVVKERIKEVKVPVIKEIEVPVIKEIIKEVPIIKERIKEVKVPVIKEKKVPVIQIVKVPSGDPAIAKRMEESIKEINTLKLDSSRQSQDLSFMGRQLEEVKSRLQGVEDMKADVKAIGMRIDKVDFQGLSKDIYDQFSKLREILESSAGKADPTLNLKVEDLSDDVGNLQSDVTRTETEMTRFLEEVRESVVKLRKMEEMIPEVGRLKKRLNEVDFSGLSQEIYSQFEKMNISIKESEEKTNEFMEKIRVEMKTVHEKASDATDSKEHVENLDVAGLRRDLEALKQKNQYIESHLERVDISPVVELIKEVENKVEAIKSTSALIIE